MGVRVELDLGALQQYLTNNPAVQAALDEATEITKTNIEEGTPKKTGYARRSLIVRRPARTRRRIYSRDPFWHLIEWGSINNPPYGPMRHGARETGLRFDEHGGDILSDLGGVLRGLDL